MCRAGYVSNKRVRKCTYYEGRCPSAFLFRVWSPFSLMITLFTAPTMHLRSGFIKEIWDHMSWTRLSYWTELNWSNPVCETSQPLIDNTFSVSKTQMKLSHSSLRIKSYTWSSFFAQTCLEIRLHKPWHYFILLCASVKNRDTIQLLKTDDCGT